MSQIYKHGNDNFKLITLLFILQIILGVLPVVLLALYIVLELYNMPVVGYVFIGVMIISAGVNITVTKRYNVLLSGFRGEKSVVKTAKKLGSEYAVFTNLPIRYKKNRSELDLLVICKDYFLIIEVKNHSGYISGSHGDDTWLQRKVYRDGKSTETAMQNPIKQLRRQREIVKSILQANGIDIWVETMLYFSAPSVHLYLDLYDSDNVCSSEKELIGFLDTFKSEKPLNGDALAAATELFKKICREEYVP